MIPPHIQDGSVALSSPCQVPWQTMEATDCRNKFCGNCQKVVHDITGMRRAEIYALLQSDPGNICVNFVEARLPKDTETKFPKAKPLPTYRLKAIAAGAALLFMLQQAQAAPFTPSYAAGMATAICMPAENPSNTLITGTVVDRAGNLVPESMDIIISHQGREVLRLQTRGGLFSADLKGILTADAHVTIEVIPGPQLSSKLPQVETVDDCDTLKPELSLSIEMFTPSELLEKKWSGGKKEIILSEGQNIMVEVDYQNYVWNLPVMSCGSGPGFGYQRMGGVPMIITTFETFFVVEPTKIVSSPPQKVQDQRCTDR